MGSYHFVASFPGLETIQDKYDLKVIFPADYPNSIPKVFETAGKINRKPEYHTNADGSLCLGSDLNVLSVLKASADISYFFRSLVEPFLYSSSFRKKHGKFPYGELKHGEQGLIQDYEVMFRVSGKDAVLNVLRVLGKRKRVANKIQCPCGCGHRLGKCDFRYSLIKWRQIAKRRWYREHLRSRFE